MAGEQQQSGYCRAGSLPRRLLWTVALGLAILCGVASAASAQEWSTIDLQNGESLRVTVSNDVIIIPDAGSQIDLPAAAGVHVNLYGQAGWQRFGGYFQIPLSHVDFSGDQGTGRVTSLHGLELGAMYDFFFSSEQGMVVRLGLIAPSATSQRPEIESTVRAIGSQARVTDFAAAVDATTLRLGLSPHLDMGYLYGQLDLGVDTLLDSGAAGPLGRLGAEVLFRLNAALGARWGRWGLQVESANILFPTVDDRRVPVPGFHTLHVGLTAGIPYVTFRLGATFPLHDLVRGELFVVGLGVAFAM